MNDIEKGLSSNKEFIRIHRSHIVRKDSIQSYNPGQGHVEVMREQIPIGKTYREKVKSLLDFRK